MKTHSEFVQGVGRKILGELSDSLGPSFPLPPSPEAFTATPVMHSEEWTALLSNGYQQNLRIRVGQGNMGRPCAVTLIEAGSTGISWAAEWDRYEQLPLDLFWIQYGQPVMEQLRTALVDRILRRLEWLEAAA